MSALARYFNQRGAEIFGYDKTETTLTKKLVEEGMKIHYEDDPAKIPGGVDAVIYTPAIPSDHRELNHLMNSEIPVLKRSEMLGVISRAKKCIAIAGTHGKTTTSSMTAHLLKHAGRDISCFLGGIAKNFDSNYCYGEDDWTVIEADEFDRSFHTLNPEIAVLISMDPDHLDIYGEKERMQESFETFLKKVNDGGQVIIHETLIPKFSENFLNELRNKNVEILAYGSGGNDFNVKNLRYEDGRQIFDFNEIKGLSLMMPGQHNVANMCAAMGVAKLVGLTDQEIEEGVRTFAGIKRRFEITEGKDRVYVDDYAHHPSELRETIRSARQLWKGKKLTVVFQPHLFSRTRDFMAEFAEELKKVDDLILLEIYPAREKPMEGITSKVLLNEIDMDHKAIVKEGELLLEIKKRDIEVLMTLGAGDIDVFAEPISEWIKNNDQ